jgi:hypothetical protein
MSVSGVMHAGAATGHERAFRMVVNGNMFRRDGWDWLDDR